MPFFSILDSSFLHGPPNFFSYTAPLPFLDEARVSCKSSVLFFLAFAVSGRSGSPQKPMTSVSLHFWFTRMGGRLGGSLLCPATQGRHGCARMDVTQR